MMSSEDSNAASLNSDQPKIVVAHLNIILNVQVTTLFLVGTDYDSLKKVRIEKAPGDRGRRADVGT